MKPRLEDCYYDYVSKTALVAMLRTDCRTARIPKDYLQSVVDVLNSEATLQDAINMGAFEGYEATGITREHINSCDNCHIWADCSHPAKDV